MRTTFRAYSNVNKQTIFFSRERLKEVHMMDYKRFINGLSQMYQEKEADVDKNIEVLKRGIDTLSRKKTLTAIQEAQKCDWECRIAELSKERKRLSDAIYSISAFQDEKHTTELMTGYFPLWDEKPTFELMREYFRSCTGYEVSRYGELKDRIRIMFEKEIEEIEEQLAERGIIVFDGLKCVKYIMQKEPAEDYGDEYL